MKNNTLYFYRNPLHFKEDDTPYESWVNNELIKYNNDYGITIDNVEYRDIRDYEWHHPDIVEQLAKPIPSVYITKSDRLGFYVCRCGATTLEFVNVPHIAQQGNRKIITISNGIDTLIGSSGQLVSQLIGCPTKQLTLLRQGYAQMLKYEKSYTKWWLVPQ